MEDFNEAQKQTIRRMIEDEIRVHIHDGNFAQRVNSYDLFGGLYPSLDASYPSPQTYTPAVAGTATLDLSLANEHRITMPAGNITIAVANTNNGQKFVISITQDSGGSRTVTWFTTIKWAGGAAPTLTTTADKRDTFGFIRTGEGTYDGFIVGQNI